MFHWLFNWMFDDVRIINSREMEYDDRRESHMPTVLNAAGVAFFTDVGTTLWHWGKWVLGNVSEGLFEVVLCINVYIVLFWTGLCITVQKKNGGKGRTMYFFSPICCVGWCFGCVVSKITPTWGRFGTYQYAIKTYKGIGHNPQEETCQRFVWQFFIVVQFL